MDKPTKTEIVVDGKKVTVDVYEFIEAMRGREDSGSRVAAALIESLVKSYEDLYDDFSRHLGRTVYRFHD
jgi:hypothetical protein